ncbi:uncharacterized protein LOC143297141, partial [Babylonia areolata]|uniref:uncharacterized protein LOC143297141 n=1 Tax=Babylonia areolata TaxID=304850 RepID=UPI003FD4DBC4
MGVHCAVLLLLATVAKGYVVLEEKAYVQLNDAGGQKSINASTYNRLAFDYGSNILYTTAKEPGRLTAFTLQVDGSPVPLTEVEFDTALKGQPLDVEFCRPLAPGGVPRLAVSFQDPVSASADGTVRLYQALTPLTTELALLREITVGALPIDIEFGADCNMMLVANKGRPTKEGNAYRDPEGTVTKILLPFDLSPISPITTTTISFASLFTGVGSSEYIHMTCEVSCGVTCEVSCGVTCMTCEVSCPVTCRLLREGNFRYFPLRKPDGSLLTVMQNIEPHNLVIAPNGLTAYVSLPKNNAIARLNLETNQVSSVFPLGNRSWTDYYMDPSDNDGEVNMRGYNIYSLFQATEMQWVVKDGREWLLTIDTGFLNDVPEYSYSDYQRARLLASNGAILVSDSELDAQLRDDTELDRETGVAWSRSVNGRWPVPQRISFTENWYRENLQPGPSCAIETSAKETRSTCELTPPSPHVTSGRLAVSVEDGKRDDGLIDHVFTFGGRGFSVHNANNFDTPTAIVDSIEQVTKQYFPSLFNTAYLADTSTPQSDREATSPFLGPNLSAMEVGEFDGKTVVFFGGGSSGILYVYMLAPDAV